MNSFNFVNATFDNLFWRFPTNAEFDAAVVAAQLAEAQAQQRTLDELRKLKGRA